VVASLQAALGLLTAEDSRAMPGILQDEPLLNAVWEFCASRLGARSMLTRADIDPVEMPRFGLPYLVLLDVFDQGARFRWRLAGTAVVRRFGRDATGRFGEEVLSGDYLAFITSLTGHACRSRVPIYSHAVFHWGVTHTMTTSRLYVPLGDDKTGVTQILGAHAFGTKANLARNSASLLREAKQIDELLREEVPF
jgi:hypothetical protein